MLFAFDCNDNRIHIDDTQSNSEYYCPYCGEVLATRKGDIRSHHFAHRPHSVCSDSWAGQSSSQGYDMSDWHNEWQEKFPKENQEIKITLGKISHRADVLIGRTVIEFQHSVLSSSAFDNRNNFYFNSGDKVIWLFDLTEYFSSGAIVYSDTNSNGMEFLWNNPKKAFNSYDVKSGCIELFFQCAEGDEKCILRVTDISGSGFERFYSDKLMSKNGFLEYVGLKDGICPPPDLESLEKDEAYCAFKEKYHIALNEQQERAMQSVEGSVLLLAVPGSGKTTVLVDRIGHMILNKGINPNEILALTYNKKAQLEMKQRFIKQFGTDITGKVHFQTINSLSYEIYTKYCDKNGKTKRSIIPEKDRRSLLLDILKKYNEDYPSENDIQEFNTAIAYFKNNELTDEEIIECDKTYPSISKKFSEYQDRLKAKNQMDFDDQMVFALAILEKKQDELCYWKSRYKYICVDEAQDTSKIQHHIIRLLSEGNQLFMVGDEDQSIYGFRGAYPKALLNFKTDYTNPFILRMERNYRSTSQIVGLAQKFISANTGRYEKHMVSERGPGNEVSLIDVTSREEQFDKVIEIAGIAKPDTAILYRDNESSVVLADAFLRNGIPFRMKKPEMDFFGNMVVSDMIAYLRLVNNPNDARSFKRIAYKNTFFIHPNTVSVICNKMKYAPIFDVLNEEIEKGYIKKHIASIRCFSNTISELKGKSPSEVIDTVYSNIYSKYCKSNSLDTGKIDILRFLAKREKTVESFLKRIEYLKAIMEKDMDSANPAAITLSTIHSSKGLEYDTVYLIDVYDGRFPCSMPNPFETSKDNANGEMEERRLFYVGMTRAKNDLAFFRIKGKDSAYLRELFPEMAEKSSCAKEKVLSNTNKVFPGNTPTSAPRTYSLSSSNHYTEDQKNVFSKDEPIAFSEVRGKILGDLIIGDHPDQIRKISSASGNRPTEYYRVEYLVYEGERCFNLYKLNQKGGNPAKENSNSDAREKADRWFWKRIIEQ